MNIIDYIRKNGDKSFNDKPLNEVDKLIFASLSYVDFKDTVKNNSKVKRSISDVSKEFFNKKYDKTKNITAIRGSIKLLKLMGNSIRYKDLLLYNFERVVNSKQQFGAVTIEINKKLVYVSFEGTDEAMIGWEEDFRMSYIFPVISQRSAVKYLNKHFLFKNVDIIVGGHSKGGNLALVSSMYANIFVRNKIKEVYSYDGPGLLKKQLNSRKYKRIENKFKHVIPNNSLVGMMLYSTNDVVVKTKSVGMVSHFYLKWIVTDNDLVYDELKSSSIELNKKLDGWVEKYTKKQKKTFVKEMFDVFRKNNIDSLLDMLIKPMVIIRVLTDASKVEEQTSLMYKEFTSMVRIYFTKSVKEKIIP